MSVMSKDGCKVILPRSGRDELWKAIRRHYAGADNRSWRRLAMLWLRVYSDWPLEQIGSAFGISSGHVLRSLRMVRMELRDHLLATPEMLAGLRDSEPGRRSSKAESDSCSRS